MKVGKTLLLFDEAGNRLDLLTLLTAQVNEGSSYECWVQVSATRRLRARLIAFPVPEEVAIKRQKTNLRNAQKHRRPVNEQIQNLTHWTLLITKIPAEELSAQEALVLLRARWQVELLFKRMARNMGRLIPLAARIPGICSVTFTPN